MMQTRSRFGFSPTAWLFAALFFSTGNFGLLNIYHVRREAQLLSLVALAVVFMTSLARPTRRVLDPLLVLMILLLLRELVIMSTWFDVTNAVVLLAIVYVILNADRTVVRSILVSIVHLAAFFSFMGLVQAVVYFVRPELIDLTTRPYASDTGSDPIVLNSAWQYLGFNTAGEATFVLGRTFTRLHSFASEPSALVVTLFAPGLLALTLGRGYRWLAFVILLFVVGPVQGGAIWLSCGIGAVLYVYFGATERFPRLLLSRAVGVFTMTALLAVIVMLQRIDVNDFVGSISSKMVPLNAVSTAFESKTLSGQERLSGLQEAYTWVFAHPFGGESLPEMPGIALVFALGAYAGFAGIVLCIWFYVLLLQQLADSFRVSTDLWTKVAICGCGGAFLQAFFFNGFGWLTPAGLIIMALLRNWVTPVNHASGQMPAGRPLWQRLLASTDLSTRRMNGLLLVARSKKP